MVLINAALLIGSTIPVVPITEMPSAIPRRGLNVRFASSTPAGIEITIEKPPAYPCAAAISQQASRIMARGTALIAAAPTGWLSPGFVTRPTPSPPSISILEDRFFTAAYTKTPFVTSGSSPLSF
jgi:hypothetical protein